ncbi:chemotaxis protein CheW [Gottschalkia acidurici 9a]|uniref:Chemotaxis protein CheW n=1 Tax=Gottschalkia acidurici (strain ATCC 7906 / DSM 604 / BCRC 14475 / CIP 104303 / KCTC 5404 / NCIMB 10678 / 9a) TaxID=1128398 RepID=K0AVP4_GOTA9|nr:chemotaxis protein CheW [Gottschalkia acidurici]AFS77913.1 chemotaxis protein CheW [Gottschalkia acidurici 9a]
MIKEDTQKDRYLIFSLGKEDYGIEIKYVIEIVGIHPITVIPDTPDYIKGVINLRGKIIPVIDVRNRFLKEAIDYHDRTCIIVVNMEDVSVGLIVDKVVEVLNIPEYNISEPPKVSKQSYQRYIKGIGKVGDKIRLILDLENLLNNDNFISTK